ncbi:MAG TPA: LptF/LptG family permease, partial [Candidatus Deferrimicrobium sp.]|nr:LptF/LptG family permease [Candidatus Deferrimicrobium sp.]
MIKKLDLYLLKSFLVSLLVVIVAIGLTIIVINIVEELRDFIDHKVPLLSIAEYYLYFGGWVLKAFMPMFILLATLFSVSMLARRNELLAMKTSGLSLYRITLPYLMAVILLAIGHLYYNEHLFPPAGRRRTEIKEFTIEKRSEHGSKHVANVYRQIRPGYFYTIASFNIDRAEGKDLKMYQANGNKLSRLITAAAVRYRDHAWLAVNGALRRFDDSAGETFAEFDELPLPDIEDIP